MDHIARALPSDPTPPDALSMRALQLASLGGDGETMQPACKLALDASFGSVERWRDEFTALGKGPDGGSGWLMLTFQPRRGSLVNERAADPARAVVGGVAILAFDMGSHADRIDDGASAAARLDAFMAHIDWAAVYARYQQAVHAATEPFGATAEEAGTAVVIDVRRAGVFAQASTMLPGARWLDPATVGLWAAELPKDRELVVYCVYGHEVGRSTALRLRAAGLNARYLHGGIDGWQAAGHPVVPKTPQEAAS